MTRHAVGSFEAGDVRRASDTGGAGPAHVEGDRANAVAI